MIDVDIGRKTGAAVFVRLVADHDDAADAPGGELMGDLLDAELTVDRLAAGHRYGVVVENLIGDVDARRDGGADRQYPGVEIGAVAEIGEDVLRLGEGRLADPRHALAAHLGEGLG